MTQHVNKQLTHHEYARKQAKFPLAVLADDFDVPMNVGNLFRLCDALGVEKLYLTGISPIPPNRKISKTARSTEAYVDYEYHDNAIELAQQLKHSGYTLIALEITSGSIDLRTVDYTKMEKICLVVGAENTGVKQALLDCCKLAIHIPMLGNNSSMNVATACAIALFDITRGMAT